MQETITKLAEIKLVGIKCRTNNAFEFDPTKAKIAKMIQKYFQTKATEKISNRIKPNTTYCVYTEYDSDHNGDYTYFIGEEVEYFTNISQDMFAITIPAQDYVKFTNGPGVMPDVCINVWQKIWQMSSKDFGGKRTYLADFEIYDSRAIDPANTVLDVFVGVDLAK